MKNKIVALFALSAIALTSCFSGGKSSKTSGSNSSSNSDSSSSSSSQVITDVFNTYKCVELLVNAANKYSSAVTVEGVLEQLKDSGEDIDVSASSDKGVSEIGATLALYYTFKDIMPEKIGARSFQALDFDVDTVEIRSAKDDSKNSPIYKAMKALGEFGFYTTPRSGTISGGKIVNLGKMKTYIDRIHYYFGESYVDDFFSTVNHDFLYDENPYQDAPNDGRLHPEDEYDADNLINIYDSNLIPESKILDFILDVSKENDSIGNFLDTYSDFDARATGNAAGLVASINKYLSASTASEVIELLRQQVLDEGYCPLWDTAENGRYTFTSGATKVLMNVQAYSYSADSPSSVAPGSSAYKTSVERFTPIFQEVLGCSDDDALKCATDYSSFKWQLAVNQASWTPAVREDTYAFLTNDPENASKYDNYTVVAFPATGELLYDFFKSIGVNDPESVMFTSRCDIESIVAQFDDEHLPYVKGLIVWQMLQHYSLCLPDEEHVTAWLYKPGYANNKETLIDDKSIFYSKICSYVSGLVSNYWTSTSQFNADSEAVRGVLENIKGAMHTRIDEADWLSSDAREKAHMKVNHMGYVVGGLTSNGDLLEFPNINYTTTSLYSNLAEGEHNTWVVAADEVGSDWGKMSMKEMFSSYDPLTANAFYYPGFNSVYITLGYMSCYPNAGTSNDVDLYSGYGWVVAHEISHGFDSSGIYYDDAGVYHEEGWFSEKDQAAYNDRTSAIANFYTGYEVMPGQVSNGKTVITEACADINGLHLVMEVVKSIPGFDYEKFFINCAHNFGDYASTYTYTSALASDEHPFGRARVNLAMMSIDEWHDTFGTKEGDNMWVEPEDRPVIW